MHGHGALASAVLAFGLLALPAGGGAAELKASGTVTYVTVYTDNTDLEDGRAVQRFQLKGVILSDDPRSPFHLSAQDCLGTAIVTGQGMTAFVAGYCDVMDSDGDAWWLSWRQIDQERNGWQVLGGLGKYQGMTGSGEVTWLTRQSDGRAVARYQGSVNLK